MVCIESTGEDGPFIVDNNQSTHTEVSFEAKMRTPESISVILGKTERASRIPDRQRLTSICDPKRHRNLMHGLDVYTPLALLTLCCLVAWRNRDVVVGLIFKVFRQCHSRECGVALNFWNCCSIDLSSTKNWSKLSYSTWQPDILLTVGVVHCNTDGYPDQRDGMIIETPGFC
jgi:hypothetical protein